MKNVVVISDFSEDYYHAVMKGVILTSEVQVQIIDVPIRHKFSTINTSWVLLNLLPYYPHGTIFLIVVDPGVGTSRRPLAVKLHDYELILPDNGIITPFIEEIKGVEEITSKIGNSTTFHGRDIFAAAVSKLLNGRNLGGVQVDTNELVRLNPIRPQTTTGMVVDIDSFGNIVTNIMPSAAEKIKMKVGEDTHEFRHVRTFADIEPTTLAVITGSCNTYELVSNQGSAYENLGNVQIGDRVKIIL